MKNAYLFLATLMLSLTSVASFAATESFWAFGTSDSFDYPKYLNTTGTTSAYKDIAIDYVIDRQKWTINSAQLLLKAVDDNNYGGHCTNNGASPCLDSTGKFYDGTEYAVISKIDGTTGTFTSTAEISQFGWYDVGLNVTSYLLNDKNDTFTARIQASLNSDFWYKNAKLVIDYDLKPVPVPAAIWLFGSALAGLAGWKRRVAVTA